MIRVSTLTSCRVLVGILLLLTAALAQEGGKKKGRDFSGKSLRMRDFTGQNLENAVFDDADCFLAQFNGAVAPGASFRNTDLTSSSFTETNASGADFRGANLESASLQRANLANANFEGQELGKTSLQGSDLRGANLRKLKSISDITGADLRGADLRGAVLLGAKDYSNKAKYRGAKYDKSTRWPVSFDVEASGAVLTESPDEGGAPAGGLKIPSPAEVKRDGAKPDGDKLVVSAKPAGAPSEEIVKKALETGLWGPPFRGTKHRYRYLKMLYSDAVDTINVGGGKMSKVYPIKVVGEITTIFPDGVERTEAKNQSFRFFKDEFGEWTFQFIQNNTN